MQNTRIFTGSDYRYLAKDSGEIVGVDKDCVEVIMKDFITSINNGNKIYPPMYLMPQIFEVNDKKIIYINVPKGSQVRRHNGVLWDRSYEGAIDISKNEELVYKMYARKQGSYFVNKIYVGLGMDFLDAKVIEKARKMAITRVDGHPWALMTHEEMLRSAGLILTDMETYKEGITLAAILLFGKDNSIMSVIPQYKTDAIYRVKNLDRYDDRDVIITNLIDSYERLMAHGIGELNLNKFAPFPKNPSISKIFREIGLADELGSGMINTNKYTKLYSGGKPVFDEGDIFRIKVPLSEDAIKDVESGIVGLQEGDVGLEDGNVGLEKENVGLQEGDVGLGNGNVGLQEGDVGLENNSAILDEETINKLILTLIYANNKITKKLIANKIGVSEKTIERQMKGLNQVKFVGKGRHGHWEVQ